MKVGITGTRYGWTDKQGQRLREELLKLPIRDLEFHHGSCSGVNVDAARMVFDLFGSNVHVVDDKVLPPKTHFARNRDIVNAVDLMLALPRELLPQSRGGTWYTINYAVKVGKPVKIIWPDGTLEER